MVMRSYPRIKLFVEAFPEDGRNTWRFQLVLMSTDEHVKLVMTVHLHPQQDLKYQTKKEIVSDILLL
jgi:hypothetical protein